MDQQEAPRSPARSEARPGLRLVVDIDPRPDLGEVEEPLRHLAGLVDAAVAHRVAQVSVPRYPVEAIPGMEVENPRNILILPARYLQKDARSNVVETPEEMFRRMAENVAQPEAEYGNDIAEMVEAFYDMMTSLAFMPNSPTLMNAGPHSNS